MKKTNSVKLELSEDSLADVFRARDNDPKYKQAVENLKSAIESVTESKKDLVKIDDAAIHMETIACDITYRKAFSDGMNFVLNAMAGKDVIEI
ncbi:MAG TPA: hypothetical protein VEG39_08500 [Clostridia bacterium]|nr:hypothetical protein [Clostridia bacterium]